MIVDLPGRVGNIRLPYRKGLHAVFEAVVNSIHAIEERKGEAGRIEILVVRDDLQAELDGDVNLGPVQAVVVTDNGVGFTDQNFESFGTSDSRYKKTYGAKGVGRLLWLKAFEEAHVESVFEGPEKKLRRTFDFRLSKDGIENVKVEPSNGALPSTIVRLSGMRERYRQLCPKKLETIALKILDHCLIYFTQDDCPRITVSDEHERLVLNDLYLERLATGSTTTRFNLKGRDFSAIHLRVRSPDDPKHLLHFCAHKREVVEENLASYIPNLGKRLTDESGQSFFVSSYVSGALLDEAVNAERTEFNLPDESDLLADEVGIREIRREAVEKIRQFVAPQLECPRSPETAEIWTGADARVASVIPAAAERRRADR